MRCSDCFNVAPSPGRRDRAERDERTRRIEVRRLIANPFTGESLSRAVEGYPTSHKQGKKRATSHAAGSVGDRGSGSKQDAGDVYVGRCNAHWNDRWMHI